MKIIDSNGRLFGKISILDVLVLIVVLVMAGALYVKTNHNEITSTATPDADITYQVLVSGVRSYVGDAVQVGDKMYDVDRSSGGTLGEIIAVEVLPSGKLGEFKDGTVETVPVEDGVNLLITVKGSGLVNDGRYVLNRVYDLGVNSSRNFYTPYVQFSGVVAAILGD